MHCLKIICTNCNREFEMMTEHDSIDGFVCCACVIAIKTKDKVVKILDGAPRGYVKGSINPVKQ